MNARTPESLTRLERAWLKRRYCAWCEAATYVNACHSQWDRCSDDFLNERRGKWLAEDYKPRPAKVDTHPKGGDCLQAPAPLSGAVPGTGIRPKEGT